MRQVCLPEQFAVTSVTPPFLQLWPVPSPRCEAMPWGPSLSLISKENVKERHRNTRETEKETEVPRARARGKVRETEGERSKEGEERKRGVEQRVGRGE